jgi:hypothetical protein
MFYGKQVSLGWSQSMGERSAVSPPAPSIGECPQESFWAFQRSVTKLAYFALDLGE